MAWNISGSYFESCSCEVICPCTASLSFGATYDRCKVVLVFNIAEGEIEGVAVGGTKVAVVADTPKVMTDGNWRIGVFLDADEQQAEKLGAVFGGQLGGPLAGLVPLIGENLGAEMASIEIHEDGLKHSIKIGDKVDFEIEDIVPFGVETGQPARLAGIFHPASSELNVAHATHGKVDAFGIAYEGKSGFSAAKFAWAA